jgi:phage terminase large subunit-like protein
VVGGKRWLGKKASLLVFQEGLNDIHGMGLTLNNQKNNKRRGT